MSNPPKRALIFDLDGVLVDSEPLHLRASQRLVVPQQITEEQYARFTGVAIEPFMKWVQSTFGLADSIESLTRRYEQLVTKELSDGPVEPLDGAPELIAIAREAGWAIGLASQSTAAWVQATLKSCGLNGSFDVEVNGDNIVSGKPSPEIYLFAAKKLRVTPSACIAIEDSPAGVQSATEAGMLVVQSQQASTAAPSQPTASIVLDSLREVDLQILSELLSINAESH